MARNSRPNRTFMCAAHGAFLSDEREPDCPHGCSTGMVSLVSPPMINTSGARTKFIDRKTADLARQFGESEFNDRYDKSRIDMTKTDDIQKKRMTGQTYAVPLNPENGVAGYIGSTSAPEIAVSDYARQKANEGLNKTTIVADDQGRTKLSEAA